MQYNLFTNAERATNAFNSRIVLTSLVIWCVTCLIHGCSLTRFLPHLPFLPHYPTTQRERSVHPEDIQAPSVDKLLHQDLQSDGNPRTTTPTSFEPKKIATPSSKLILEIHIMYMMYRKNWRRRRSPALITKDVEEFGKNLDGWCARLQTVRHVPHPTANAFRRIRGTHCRF